MADKKLQEIKKAESLFSEKRLAELNSKISEEDRERYAKIGEEFYNSLDFQAVNSQGISGSDDAESVELENVSQLKLMLQSGMHPSYLNGEEKAMMKNSYGEKWYETYGFLETDLNRINF